MPDDLVFSTSAFGDAALCLKRYEYRHVEKLVPRPVDVRPTMRRGTWIHRLLQLGDLGYSGIEMRTELDRMADWALEHEVPEDQVKTLHTQVWDLVQDYYTFWDGREHREGGPYETVATEEPVIYYPAKGYGISATIDRIVRDPKGRLWLWERKSTEDIPDADWRCVDPQTMIQYIAARQSGKYNVVGVIFDYVRTDPGPTVRVYKPVKSGANAGRGGRIYQDVINKAVTQRAFAAALPEIAANWQDGPDAESPAEYVKNMATRMVNDGAWFQRFQVMRPDDNAMATLKDVAMTMRYVREAQERGHYRRSFNILTCRLFCPYGKLCMAEYILGRPSPARRDEWFTVETPDIRSEGRSEDVSYSTPGHGAR